MNHVDAALWSMRNQTLSQRAQYLGARLVARLPACGKIWLSGEPPVVIDGQQLDPQLQFLRAFRRRINHFGLVEPTIAAGRARYRRETLVFRGPMTPVAAVREIEIPTSSRTLRARHYVPDVADTGSPMPLTVYFHGGGFVIGDLDTHDEPCRILCHHGGMHVLSVAYRLAPEHPFPAAVEDAHVTLEWAQANARSLGVDPHRIAVGGDSAGATLSIVAAAEATRRPAAQLLIYPATDASREYRSHALFGRGLFLTVDDREAFYRSYLEGSGARRDDPRISPLCMKDPSLLPPSLLITAGFDILRDEADAFGAALAAAGVTVTTRRFDALGHGFIHMTGVCPAAREAMLEIAREWRALVESVTSMPQLQLRRNQKSRIKNQELMVPHD